MSRQKGDTAPRLNTNAQENLILCRVAKWGSTSMKMTIPLRLARALGVVGRDVIGVRLVKWNERVFFVGERVPLDEIATHKQLPIEEMLRRGPKDATE